MIAKLAKGQNWAKAAPWLAAITTILLFLLSKPSEPIFWALLNIPLYLLHQTEEHLWPGGFKDYMNKVVNRLPDGQESLTDSKVFWINILLVWVAFTVFAVLAFVNIGFGLLMIVFSMMNCLTHIAEGIRRRRWNPGLVMATIQFLLSIYAGYFITVSGFPNALVWWIGTVVFSAAVHAVVFKTVLKSNKTKSVE
jgi:hypothetical protein